MSEKIGVLVFTKPCKILQYCPYGVLVEDFPLLPNARAKAIEMGWYSKLNPDGPDYLPCAKDDEGAMPSLSKVYKEFGELDEESCSVFGHNCPVYYVAERFVDNKEMKPVE